MVTFKVSASKAAACSASSIVPKISKRPALLNVTVGTGSGSGKCAAANSAAILGDAFLASALQPPVSRMLTNLMTEVLACASTAKSPNRRCSWVQATTTSSVPCTAWMKAPASRRHSAVCSVSGSDRLWLSAFGSRGWVWLQSQISVVMRGGLGVRSVFSRDGLCHDFGVVGLVIK